MSKLGKNNNKPVQNIDTVKPALPVIVTVMKLNRLVLAVMISLMAAIVFLGVLLIPDNQGLKEIETSKALYDVEVNPVVSAEVDALKSQLVGLVSGSIESKLKRLEKSLQAGTISETGLETIRALQGDLMVLKTYSETGAGRLIVDKYQQKTVQNIESVVLAEEVSHLKQLVYMLLSSCALMFSAMAGVWLRKQYRLEHKIDQQDKERFLS